MVVVPSRMRGLNRRSLFQRLQRLGSASRAELAKSLGMSAPTAGKIVDELLDLGIVEEVGEARVRADTDAPGLVNGRLGRPGRRVRLERTRPRFLGIELGVSETRLTLLPVGATEQDHWMVRVPTGHAAADWHRHLARAATQLPCQPQWGVILSVPGILDEATGRVHYSPNLHWTEGLDLRDLVRQVWNLPVEMVQEERVLALGHQLADSTAEDLLLVDFGEGVGGAIILGGKVYHSRLPISGELGHTPVRGNLRPCGCGAVGCVETLVARNGLLQSFAATQRHRSVSWEALVRHVAQHGVPGWLAEALDAMGTIIASALNVLGLQHVVITGLLTELPSPVLDSLRDSVKRGAVWARFGTVDCQGAPRRRTAGLVAVGIDRLIMPLDRDGLL